jgi:acyl carrier protein
MPRLVKDEVIKMIIGWIKEHKQKVMNSGDTHITEDTDLITTGLLDSFGFVDLFLFLEAQSGCQIDLTDVEVSDFSTVKGLCGIVLANICRPNAHVNC